MFSRKSMLASLFAVILIAGQFFQTAKAASIYEPDNSLRADPLQASKQMGGNLEVGEFTGAAIYHYPISLPAGRNGMSPSVQLTYNSQDSALDNIVGFHWSLTQHSIKRINKKGVEKMYDRTDFVASGPFGGGELTPIALNDGQHGQFGEKTERSFARYEYNADGGWIVTDKRGVRYLYGATEEGRQADPDDPNRVFQWMLEEVRDPNDNGIRFVYFKDGNQIYPKTIRYTNHGTEEGIFEVRFLPFADNGSGGTRADGHASFAEGFRVDTQRLVTEIQVMAEGRLRRKYEIGYVTVDPLIKNTIGYITETGFGLDGNPTTLPATTFEYTPSVVSWGETTDYLYPGFFQTCYVECESNGAEWDMNGDGLTDFESLGNGTAQRHTNNGKNGWSTSTGSLISINQPSLPNLWSKPIDFDGDNSPEIVTSYSSQIDGLIHSTIQPIGRPTISDTIQIAFGLPSYGMNDNGASVADLNGDGLPDILQSHSYYYSGAWSSTNTIDKSTCLNTDGNSCIKTALWEAPVIFSSASGTQQSPRQHFVQDCNTDGLADVVYTGSGGGIWTNDGKGGWIPNATRCDLPLMDSLTYRSLDANGDGLMDQVISYLTITDWGQFTTNQLNINTGNGFKTYSNVFPLTLGGFASGVQSDGGVRIADLNGDSLPDVVMASLNIDTSWRGVRTETKRTFLNQGTRPYFLKTVHTSGGTTIEMETKNSAQLRTSQDTQANPKLPLNLPVLTKMTMDDGFGNKTLTEYQYEDGHYYFQNSDNREFAGFRVITKTDALGNKTKTYFHQDEFSVADGARGEWDDHISKKGSPYREEIYDNAGKLIRSTINRFEKMDLGNGRFFPYLKQTVAVDFDSDTGNKRATAKTFDYDAFGNPIMATDFGEVSLNSEDGSFSDVGQDLVRQLNSYAQNETDHMVGFLSGTELQDQGNQKLAAQKIYYDGLPLGQVSRGNPTSQSAWLDSRNMDVTTSVTFDAYGLPIQQTNARGFSTTMEYGADHIYPTKTTNALGHVSTMETDVALGKPIRSIDPNGLVSQNTYDGFGRLIKAEMSDPQNPDSLVTLKTAEFDDFSMPRASTEISYNNDGTTVRSVAFSDGLGRTMETKRQWQNGKWLTGQTTFDERGNVRKNIQPFLSNSSSFEATDEGKIGTEFSYDTLNRTLTATDAVGLTRIAYRLWAKTTTDPDGKVKDYNFDARGLLVEVGEHAGSDIQRTAYAYNPMGKLVGITDSVGNTREFAYDSLGRLTGQTLAHKPFESPTPWTYDYDENGNRTLSQNPLGQMTANTFDALDRMTAQDFSTTTGTDFSFIYDQGTNAIGRLASVSGQNYTHALTYDLWGRSVNDQRTIDGKDYTFASTTDWMGGQTSLTYPDGSAVEYNYDDSHMLASVSGGGKIFAQNLDYAPNGGLAQIDLGNGVTTASQFEPAQMMRLVSKTSILNETDILQNLQYTYDPAGNLMSLNEQADAITKKSVAYQYDDLHRILQADYTDTFDGNPLTESYEYDALGNLTHKSDIGDLIYAGPNPHSLTNAGKKTFGYDGMGNMTTRDGKTMAYDPAGKLVGINGETAYLYDEGGQRIMKTDLKTGEKTVEIGDLYELAPTEETKYINLGSAKVAKVVKTITPPPAPVPDPTTNPTTDPSTSSGSGPAPATTSATTTGGGGGGGYSNPFVAGGALTNLSANHPGVIANPLGDKAYWTQSGTKENTPPELWPTGLGKSLPEFRNVTIQYQRTKAILTWDGMPKEVRKFQIYRSEKPHSRQGMIETSVLLTTLTASNGKNRFVDSVKPGQRYDYRIAALNRKNEIIQISVAMTPETLFIGENGTRVDFSKFFNLPFDKVELKTNSFLSATQDRTQRRLTLQPKFGFQGGTRVQATYIKCGKTRCNEIGHKTFDVFVVPKNSGIMRLTKAFMPLVASLFPTAVAQESDGTERIYYFLTDHLGGIEAVLDEAGKATERRDFMPFGAKRVSDSGTEKPENLGFTGKKLDEESGLNYFGARYYDSAIGRFTTVDPLVLGESAKSLASALSDPQQLNGYSYVGNNPMKRVDRNGEYGKPFHLDFTNWVFEAAGVPQRISKALAIFNQSVDDDPRSAPRGEHPFKSDTDMLITVKNVLGGVTEKNHFAPRSEAIKMVENANTLQELGNATHTLQDTYSHHIMGEGIQNMAWHTILTKSQDWLGTPTDPDNTENAPTKALMAGVDTFMVGRAYIYESNPPKTLLDMTKFSLETVTRLTSSIPAMAEWVSAKDKSKTKIGGK